MQGRLIRAATGAAIAAVMGTGAVPAGAQAPVSTLPSWMAGCWVQEKDAGGWTEECWTAARGGTMLGSGRSGRGDRTAFWEVMQILPDAEGLSFWGAPKGEGRTRFRAKADGGPGISFYNEAHDYPQRIRYWGEGDMLNAETALADGTKAQRWTYRRQ